MLPGPSLWGNSHPGGAVAGTPGVEVMLPAAKRRSRIDIAFGNIATWGPKARGYVSKSKADMLLFAETHLGEDELQLAELRLFMRTAGFCFAASAA